MGSWRRKKKKKEKEKQLSDNPYRAVGSNKYVEHQLTPYRESSGDRYWNWCCFWVYFLTSFRWKYVLWFLAQVWVFVLSLLAISTSMDFSQSETWAFIIVLLVWFGVFLSASHELTREDSSICCNMVLISIQFMMGFVLLFYAVELVFRDRLQEDMMDDMVLFTRIIFVMFQIVPLCYMVGALAIRAGTACCRVCIRAARCPRWWGR